MESEDSTSREILKRIDILEKRLRQVFETEHLRNGIFFKTKDNAYFRVECIKEYNCIVIEYGETKKAASLNQLEDGDLFYLNELTDEELFDSVIAEIG